MQASEIKKILEENNISVKKQYGQNFLMDDNIIKKICEISNIDKETNVIEIGPGLGFLTKELSQRAKQVLCYEVDGDMIKILTNKFSSSNVIIKYQDFLKANIDEDIKKIFSSDNVIVVANLPYYITTAILTKILNESKYIKQLTVMMQEEVAQRICGTPSTKDYNALSVLIQYYTNTTNAIKVPSSVFFPAPKVDSSVVLIKKKDTITNKVLDEKYFKTFIYTIFAQRRKTLINNLKKLPKFDYEKTSEIFNELNIDLSVRAEKLSVDEIVNLTNKFYLSQN